VTESAHVLDADPGCFLSALRYGEDMSRARRQLHGQRLRGLASLLTIVALFLLPAPSASAQTEPPPVPSSPVDSPVVSPFVGPIQGQLREGRFFSPALGRDMTYFVYLPPTYGADDGPFPTLYLLHGNSGDKEEWLAYGVIDIADAMITAQEIAPLVIVLPQGDFSYWVNLVPAGARYGDYLRDDLVAHIDASYQVLPLPEQRAIGGLSMGGTGALIRAFRDPAIFGVVGAHSPALPREGERPFLGTGPAFARRDPVSLAAEQEGIDDLTIWLDIGDQDDWLPRTEVLDTALAEREIPHEFVVFPGEHWGGYWGEHLPEYLSFYSEALSQASAPDQDPDSAREGAADE
jgi:enterochelin esterase-like enzyme